LSDRRHYLFDNSRIIDSGAGQHTLIINTDTAGTNFTFQLYASTSLLSGVNTAQIDKSYIITAISNSDKSIIRYNGKEVSGSDIGANPIEPVTYIGRGILNSASSSFLDGYIAEFIIFDRVLKKSEYKAVESYLQQKWGVNW